MLSVECQFDSYLQYSATLSDLGVISSEDVKTIEGCAVLNFEVASFSNFRDIKEFIS